MGFYDISAGKGTTRAEQHRLDGMAAIAKARGLEETASGRGFTPDEQAAYDQHVAEAKSCVDAMRSARGDEEFIAGVGALFGDGQTHELAGMLSAKDKRLSYKGMGAALARQIMPDASSKALAPSGSAVVPQALQADVVALGQPAQGLSDVIPVEQFPTPELSYLRQTVRTNNAAVVAANALKPTSIYTVNKITASLQVIAHLSEAIPRHWLLDSASVEAWLDNELRFGLAVAVEAKILADVNGTSGIQTVAYTTSVLATMRAGITALEQQGLQPSAYVLTPADWAGIELGLASQAAVEHLSLPYDSASRRLFGVPVVVSNAQAAGVGHVIASGAVSLATDTRGVDVQYSENATADSFGKNQVFARCESRYATLVYSPLGVATLDLTP